MTVARVNVELSLAAGRRAIRTVFRDVTLRLAHATVIMIKVAVRLVALSCTLLEEAQAVATDLQTLQVGLCPLRSSRVFAFASTFAGASTDALESWRPEAAFRC